MRKGKHIVSTLLLITTLLCLIAAGALAQGTLTLPSALKVVEDEAFYGSTAYDVVELPEGIERIGSRAFAGSSIKGINLPVSLKSIAEDAFEGCAGLEVTAEPGSYAYDWAVGAGLIAQTDFDYVIENGEVTITGYTGTGTEVSIPAEIAGYPVVGIGDEAFRGCSSLANITILDGLNSIGNYAFYGCSNLKSITLPDGLTSICAATFAGCRSLMNITVPDGVTSIGNDAFRGCSSLTTITLPDGLTSIGFSAFYGCSNLTTITLPASVTSIRDFAFEECISLASITIPDGVTSIGNDVFAWCRALMSITIPDGVTSIGKNAFYACSSLTNITIPDGVTSIGYGAFSGCSSLTSITLPDGVISIGNDSFYGCSNLTSITLPDGVTSIGDNAFRECSSLVDITIPASVTSIGSEAFSGCSSVFAIHGVSGSYAETYAAQNGIPFVAELIEQLDLDYVIKNGEVTITRYTGAGTEVIIPTKIVGCPVVSIGDDAFHGCSGLTSITLPNGVTSIGNFAFYGCSGMTSITIPDSVTGIGNSAFEGCSSLTNITIPDSVTGIGNSAFEGCISLTNIALPDSVTSIGGAAFARCSGLMNIMLPNSVTSIGYSAFYGCSSLTNITIPDGVTFIGISAFYGCGRLANITIPDGVTFIGYSAFEDCNSLTSITLPDSVTSIGNDAFYGCSSLASITVPVGVIRIENSTFRGCSSLTSITFPGSLTSIGNDAFEDCSSLTSITLPDSLTRIGAQAFDGCNRLTSITLPASVTSIGDIAFRGCSSLTSITLPDGLTSIGDDVFYGCSSLTSITLPDGVTSIGSNAFSYCSSLTNITLPDGLTSIGNGVFGDCSSLTNITVPNSVTSIGNWAFNHCSGLTSITLPGGVTSIGNFAFDGCSNLTSIMLPDGLTSIGNYAFDGCSSLTTITIPDGLTSIGNYAFDGCSSLTNITLPADVTSIGECAFSSCRSLTDITIPDSVTSIGSNAFAYHSSALTIHGVSGSYAETYAAENDIHFVAGEMPSAHPTISEFTLNAMPAELIAPVGTALNFGGTIKAAGNAKLVNVQASVFCADDLTKGVVFAREEGINADSFDLSAFSPIMVGNTYTDGNQTITMEAGKSYIVMLYATDENGMGFEHIPRITVRVAEAEKPVWYADVVDGQGNNLAQNGLALDYAGTNEVYVYVTTNNGNMTAWTDAEFPFSVMLLSVSDIREDGSYLFTYRVSARENPYAGERMGRVLFCLRNENGETITQEPLAVMEITQARNPEVIDISVTDKAGNNLAEKTVVLDYMGVCDTQLFVRSSVGNISPWTPTDYVVIDWVAEELQDDGYYLITYDISCQKSMDKIDQEGYIRFYTTDEKGNITNASELLAEVSIVQRANPYLAVVESVSLVSSNAIYDSSSPIHLRVGEDNTGEGEAYQLNVVLNEAIVEEYFADTEWNWTVYTDYPDIINVYQKNGKTYVHALKEGSTMIYISHEYVEPDKFGKLEYAHCVTDAIISKDIYDINDVNNKMYDLFVSAANAYYAAMAVQYDNLWDQVTTRLFAKGGKEVLEALQNAGASLGIVEDKEIKKLVESFIIAEMDKIEYKTNVIFSDVDSTPYDLMVKAFKLLQDHGIDPAVESWSNEWAEIFATSSDYQLEDIDRVRNIYHGYQCYRVALSALSDGLGMAKTSIEFIQSLQNGNKELEMKRYMRGEAQNKLNELKNGFTDERIRDAIDQYQKDIDNAIENWAIDTSMKTIESGGKIYGEYCHFVKALKDNGVIKHLPDNVAKYVKAEQAFKDLKITKKWTVGELLSVVDEGSGFFDTISSVEGIFVDAEGYVDLIALIEKEASLLASEYKTMPTSDVSGYTKEQLLARISAVSKLIDSTWNSFDKLIDISYDMYVNKATGILISVFNLEEYERRLSDVMEAQTEMYLEKRKASLIVEELKTMIENCNELE